LDAFPSSNSRPNLNVARNQAKKMLTDKGLSVDLFKLDNTNSEHLNLKSLIEENYLTAIQKDIDLGTENFGEFQQWCKEHMISNNDLSAHIHHRRRTVSLNQPIKLFVKNLTKFF
jgi:hypothetical protein